MSLLLIANVNPYLTAAAVVGISVTFVTLLPRPTKSSTTMLGWLKQRLGWHLSLSRGDVRGPTPDAVVVRSREQHRHRRPALSALDRYGHLLAGSFAANSEFQARMEEVDNKHTKLVGVVGRINNRVLKLEEENAENRREIGINRAMINIQQEQQHKTNVLLDASNKRHNFTEGEVKDLQKDVSNLTFSVVGIIALVIVLIIFVARISERVLF